MSVKAFQVVVVFMVAPTLNEGIVKIVRVMKRRLS